MTGSSWNPPTGPPNGVPVSANDARYEIESAITAAQNLDGELRRQVVAAATDRIRCADRLPAAAAEADDARNLARRALVQANDAARAGQRDEAAKWTAAAQVFAMRVRDARSEVAALEQRVAAAGDRIAQLERACAENAGRLEAVAAARLPVLRGRKAAKARHAVDTTLAELRRPLDDAVAEGTRVAREAAAAEAEADADVEVADEDLEREVDFDGADAILAELRDELGLPAPGPGSPASDPPASGDDEPAGGAEGSAPAEASSDQDDRAQNGRSARPAAGARRPGRGAEGARGRSWPVPASGR